MQVQTLYFLSHLITNKCSQNGLIAHYQACAKVSDLPFILYNIPPEPESIFSRLHMRNCWNSKCDSCQGSTSGNFRSLQKSLPVIVIALISTVEMTTRLYLPLSWSKGVIRSFEYMSRCCQRTVLCLFQRNVTKSEQIQLHHEALLESLTSDINPVPVKTAMNMMGLSVSSSPSPLCPMDDFAAQQLKTVWNFIIFFRIIPEYL